MIQCAFFFSYRDASSSVLWIILQQAGMLIRNIYILWDLYYI